MREEPHLVAEVGLLAAVARTGSRGTAGASYRTSLGTWDVNRGCPPSFTIASELSQLAATGSAIWGDERDIPDYMAITWRCQEVHERQATEAAHIN